MHLDGQPGPNGIYENGNVNDDFSSIVAQYGKAPLRAASSMPLNLVGNAGNQSLAGGAGNDTLDGGGGFDTVLYAGSRADYRIMRSPAGHIVASKSGADGSDSLLRIERLSFSDAILDIEYYDAVQQLYVAYFGRPTDSGALSNFATRLKAAGVAPDIQEINAAYTGKTEIRDLINNFGNSTESNELYTGDTVAFVTAIYNNMFNRPPEAEGLTFWVEAISWN